MKFVQINAASLLDPRLVRLVERHGADGCRVYLEELRWPGGAECPRCASSRLGWLESREKYACRDCRYQFRVAARTVFHDSHLPLPKWFAAVALILESDAGLPASRLQQILGGSYKSAWFLEHRIRAAMVSPDGEAERRATVTRAPGVHRGNGRKYRSVYWSETLWRRAHRRRPDAFRATVLALLRHPWLPLDELTSVSRPLASARA